MNSVSNLNIEKWFSSYDKMPDLHLLTTMMDQDKYDSIKSIIKDTDYGFGMSSLFALQNQKFIYPNEVATILRYISGSNKMKDFPNGDKSVFNRIRNISIENKSRTMLSNDSFTSQLWFLPFGVGMKIEDVSNELKRMMMNDKVLQTFEVIIVNSKKEHCHNDIKTYIKNKEIKAKKEGKNGLIILAGNQLSLGVTLPLVDVVMLLNNTVSADKIVQMMYRSMTESSDGDKTVGYVFDMNMSRVLNTLLDYNTSQKNQSIEQSIEYVIQNNLINVDSDFFCKENETELVNNLLAIWKSDPVNSHRRMLYKLENINVELETDDQSFMNSNFNSNTSSSRNQEVKFDEDGLSDFCVSF